MLIEVTVCNECQRRERPTRQYTIKSEGREAEVDLCDEHGEPYERYLPSRPALPAKRAAKKVARKPQKAAGAPSRGRPQRVMTMEEIEALKAQGKI